MVERARLQGLVKRLGVRNDSLLARALTHSSYAHEEGREGEDNERLEFLGDAVIQLAVTERLYQQFPDRPEGELAKMRASVVCADSLAEAARRLGLGEHLLLGRGEEQSGGRDRVSLLCDAFEAVAAALYLDRGWEAARAFILDSLADELARLARPKPELDPKSALQERLQAMSKRTPTYRLVSESGPDHDKVFVSEVVYDGRVLGRGSGRSKKESEQEAARKALKATERWGR